MNIKKRITLLLTLALFPFLLKGQSESFKVGKNFEILLNSLKEIEANYVDSLSMDSLLRKSTELLLAQLDPYTMLIPQEERESMEMMTTGTYGGIGSLIQKREGVVKLSEVYQNSPADKAGLIDGDEILEIDGNSVAPLELEECSSRMKGTPGSSVIFTVKKLKGGDTVKVKITREKVDIPDVSYWGVIADTVGYIKHNSFTRGGAKEVKKALKEIKKAPQLKRIILDLRGNGGGLMDEAVEIVSLFVPKGERVLWSKGKGESSLREYYTTKEPLDTITPLFVMVNSGSASASEIVAGALQDLDRATVVGTRTFGKGLVQSIREVGYNDQIKITIAKYYIPSGRSVQAIDYSKRNEDGSVASIPDSIATPFKTLKRGRTVYDGGGITPDIVVKAPPLSRVTLALHYANLLSDYSYLYYSKVESIAPAGQFQLSDEEYLCFVEWVSDKEFDCRSATKVEFDKLFRLAQQEGISEIIKDELDALKRALDRDRIETLLDFKEEIKTILEEEIVNRFYYQSGRARQIIRSDNQFDTARDSAPI